MKTLQECKEQVAHEYTFQYWGQVQRIVGSDEMHDLLNEVAKLYATEKVKEALRLAAERANMVFESDVTDKKSTYKIFCSWTPEGSLEVNKESILSLQSELVNNIINEI